MAQWQGSYLESHSEGLEVGQKENPCLESPNELGVWLGGRATA